MPIDKTAVGEKTPTGWLVVDSRWVAGLFGLSATGEVKVVLGKVHVAVQHPSLVAGQVIEGTLATAFLPTGWKPLGRPGGPTGVSPDMLGVPPNELDT